MRDCPTRNKYSGLELPRIGVASRLDNSQIGENMLKIFSGDIVSDGDYEW